MHQFRPCSLVLVISLALGSCGGAAESELVKGKRDPSLNSYRHRISNRRQDLQQLIALYTPADSFPLFVSTKIGEWQGPETEKFLWRGQAVPDDYLYLFDSLPDFKPGKTDRYYATKRIILGGSIIGLLTRTPGAYWSSRIYLFLLDTKTRKFTRAYRLAESWGDAGDSFYQETYFRQALPHQFQLETRQAQCIALNEDFNNFECTDSLQTAVWSGNMLKVQPKQLIHRRQYPDQK